MKKLIYSIIFLFLLFPTVALASDDYVVTSYDVNMVVNEDNSFDVTEKIGTYFNIYKHGIFRYIPLKNTVARLDGTSSSNKARVKDIDVSDQYQSYTENGNKVIKIGDPDNTIIGSKTYTINYNYSIGRDTSKDFDELYYNIIGNGWDTSISDISFTITLPKEFDKSKLGFSAGAEGSTFSDNISYKVTENTIVGKYNGMLNAGEGLTIRLELPEGYFIVKNNDLNFMTYLSFILPILFVIIAFFLWAKYGKDNRVIETVEFYPPEGYNSAEVAFLYNGKATDKDVVSLLIYLANKGYIKISETENKVMMFTQKSFLISKVKDYDGNNQSERTFLHDLFEDKPEVTEDDLKCKFYRTIGEIVVRINNKENKNTIFEKDSLNKNILIIFMIIVIFCLITIIPIMEYGDESMLIMALLFPGIGLSAMIYGILGKSSLSTKFSLLVWGLMFAGMPWIGFVLPALLESSVYFLAYIVGIICVTIMIVLLQLMPKRNKFGNEILGKLQGFKKYLETAEKSQLELQVMQNPTYFYDILPFTYVLGVSNTWIKKFEGIACPPPDWYNGSHTFNMVTFGSFMDDTMTSATSSMTSAPSSSGSGGGFSGGGSGGGGGGSW